MDIKSERTKFARKMIRRMEKILSYELATDCLKDIRRHFEKKGKGTEKNIDRAAIADFIIELLKNKTSRKELEKVDHQTILKALQERGYVGPVDDISGRLIAALNDISEMVGKDIIRIRTTGSIIIPMREIGQCVSSTEKYLTEWENEAKEFEEEEE